MTACNEDFADWTNQATNAQGEAVNFGDGKVSSVGVINLAQYPTEPTDLDSVKVCDIVAPTTSYEQTVNKYFINLGDKQYQLSATGNMLLKDLADYMSKTFGPKPVQRDFTATVTAFTGDGKTAIKQNLAATSGKFDLKVVQVGPFIDPNGYYLVGNVDSWALTRKDMYHMKNGGGDIYDDPVFSVTIEAVPNLGSYEIKFVPASGFDGAGKVVEWKYAITALADGEPGLSGAIDLRNGGSNIKFDADPKAKKYQISVDIINGKYNVVPIKDEMFLTGSQYNWGGSTENWLHLNKVNSNGDASVPGRYFWTIIYLHAGEQFKFSPEAGWKGNDFGGAQLKVTDEAGAGYADDGSNCKVEKAGWYQLEVDAEAKTLRIRKPQVYLCGETTANGAYGVSAENIFPVPASEADDFVSPALAKDGKVRLFTQVTGVDWWRSEYHVINGNITLRTDGELTPATANKGQRVHLNFAKMSGSFK